MEKIPQNETKFVMTPTEIVHSLFDATTIQLRFILMCISKSMQLKSQKLEFHVNEYMDTMNLDTRDGHNKINLYSNLKNISKLQLEICDDDRNEYAFYNWFEYVKHNDDIITVKFTETLYNAIQYLKRYTTIDFKTVRRISASAIRYFLILKEARAKTLYGKKHIRQWSIKLSFDEIRDLFAIKGAYANRNNNFTSRVVKMPIEELNKYNLEFETSVEFKRTGRKITHAVFTCTERCDEKHIYKTDSQKIKQEKEEINEQNKQLVEMFMANPEQYRKALEEETLKLSQDPLFGSMNEETRRSFINANVYSVLKGMDNAKSKLS